MNKIALYNAGSLTLYFILAFICTRMILDTLSAKNLFLGIFASWMMLMIGVQIIHFKFKEGQFVNRFMMATTFQMLGFFSLSAYFVFAKVQDVRPLLLSLVLIHVVALVIQTIFFLRHGNKTM